MVKLNLKTVFTNVAIPINTAKPYNTWTKHVSVKYFWHLIKLLIIQDCYDRKVFWNTTKIICLV